MRYGAQFVEARVTDFDAAVLKLDGQKSIAFDILALALGGKTTLGGVKPIAKLLERVAVLAALACPRVGIIGAGAAGVETALALRARLGADAEIYLSGREFMPGAPEQVQVLARQALQASKIFEVSALPDQLDDIFYAYTLAPDVEIGKDLSVSGYKNVFAAGDFAAMNPALPRSGAVAVRQGGLLAKNILRQIKDQPLLPFAARKKTLAIMSLDQHRALGWYGDFVWQGRLPMFIKTIIDRDWVRA